MCGVETSRSFSQCQPHPFACAGKAAWLTCGLPVPQSLSLPHENVTVGQPHKKRITAEKGTGARKREME